MENVAHLYKITNNITGDYYIGKHNGCKQNGYWGSGQRIKSNILKYGEENFTYQILCYGTSEYILELESKYVTVELIESDSKCLNLSAGGLGVGRITESTREKLKIVNSGENNGMYGKKHLQETKNKISKSLIGKPLTESTKNKISQVFKKRLWINNGNNELRIEEKDLTFYENQGYVLGRFSLMKNTRDKISKAFSNSVHINDGSISKRVPKEDLSKYLEMGFSLGRMPFKKNK